jgi:ligand-binding sensor domain-containing protein/DNA-binding CsgD family transcriptional regulator
LKKIYFFLIVLLFIQIGIIPASGKDEITFEHLSVEDGLSQSSVYCILQDKKGFMWFGTFFGLDRYDGRTFTNYMNDLALPGSSVPMSLRSICEDNSGTLWFGTRAEGLCKFDRKTETFTVYKHNPVNPGSISFSSVESVFADSSGTLWVGTGGKGLDRFDPQKELFHHYRYDANNPNSLSNDFVTVIFEDSSGHLWIGTEGGLNKYDRETDSFSRYLHSPDNPASLNGYHITAIAENRAGGLWIGTRRYGVKVFDWEGETFTTLTPDTGNPVRPGHNTVSALYVDSTGMLWIGTFGEGLSTFDSKKKSFTCYTYSPDQTGCISGDIITTIYEDRSGILWIGTLAKGLNKLNRRKEVFRHYKKIPGTSNTLSRDIISSICEDRDGKLWIGTRGGVNKFDREKEIITQFHGDRGNSANRGLDRTTRIYRDRAGIMWVGTMGWGLKKYDYDTDTFISYLIKPGDPPDPRGNTIRTICEDSTGVLWLATRKGGITQFDRSSEDFSHFFIHPGKPDDKIYYDVFPIESDKDGMLWLGTLGNGIVVWDPIKKQVIERYEASPTTPGGLSNGHVIAIYPDRSGSIWVGTFGGGLSRIVPQTGISHYTMKDGLPSDIIYGMMEDNKENLWISTNRGIARFSLSNGIFKNYGPAEGLKCYEFNNGAQYKCKNGEMFFGGVNGFISFNPDRMKTNPYIPPVVFINFKIFNKPVGTGGESPLHEPIGMTKEIKLSYKQNIFSFEFAALDYTRPSKNQYKYRIDGLHSSWIYLGNKNETTFTNIEPGEYALRVTGSNNDGVWNEEGTVLKIIISPPFWRTWWFRGLILAMVFLLLYTWHRFRVNRLSLQLKTEKEMNRLYTKHRISEREQEILALLLKGMSNKEIEDALFISLPTVKSHIYSIYKKIKVKNRLELIRFFQKSIKVK